MSVERVRTILSVNFNHDGSAVVLSEGRIRGYVNTERFSRIKKHPGLRAADLAEVLDQAGVELADVDHVLLCNLHNMDSPDVVRLHGSDLKDTWFEFWLNQRNTEVRIDGRRIPCTVNPDHHLIHAATAYFTSPFESGAALAIDPTGCRAFLGRDNKLFPLRRDYDKWFNANFGYCSVSELMFGSSIVGAGKVMGLSPYGRPTGEVEPPPDSMVDFEELVRFADRDPVPVQVGDRTLNAALAYYIQLGLERQMVRLFTDLAPLCRRNGINPDICLSGGTALNAIATQLAFAGSGFERIHFHPACGDDGTAIGAALWYWHHVLGNPRLPHDNAGLMYSVRTYDQRAVDRALTAHADRLVVESVPDYVGKTAELLAGGAVVGWWDGASEVGPRALGHRSILADPRDPTMRDRLNSRVKFREHFRPFAPSVLNERATEWFGLCDSPFMLRAAPVQRASEVPAITHIDGTSRLQTVSRVDNPAFYDLIAAFEDRTGIPMVLNTSLNTKGEPIVETPDDAVRTLLGCELDYLVLPHTLVSRRGA
ncbi:carbamoyltransferase C-terminal domain-containing protein [Streptoalloteichus hindustanus]|uniref:Carbamoyltransferase n=1 Tax=Streptoalloteichus hindustanus TaxID=2017 RepID=A4KUC3_STRHI|nr:carbamoyltransferase C-terminal domain-containing protein [Streptoalloteichus hindustanus]ABL74951.1 TlmD [Streptoalloteichus hindustanus]SHF86147.1 carbamoyltransferase [Streptoalloteichus hindustanus]